MSIVGCEEFFAILYDRCSYESISKKHRVTQAVLLNIEHSTRRDFFINLDYVCIPSIDLSLK